MEMYMIDSDGYAAYPLNAVGGTQQHSIILNVPFDDCFGSERECFWLDEENHQLEWDFPPYRQPFP